MANPPKSEGKSQETSYKIWLPLLPFSEKHMSDAQETVKLENVFMR